MKRLPIFAVLASLFAVFAGALPPESGWDAVDKVFGQPGKDLPGDVHRYGWPR